MGLFSIKTRRNRAVFLTLILVLMFMLAACGKNGDKDDPGGDDPANVTQTPDPDSVVGPPSVNGDTNSGVPTTSPSASPELNKGPDVPEKEPVGDDFFEDAAFMGNSLMDGFKMFSGLTTCDYYAATSMTVVGATSKNVITLDNGNLGTMVDGLTQKPYGKIYILLGINEIGYEVSSFIDLYGEMLDKVIAGQPDCDIYIMGLTPVSYAKSTSSDTFTKARVDEYNTALYKLAADKGCYYLDLASALAGDDGYLPASETADGIHLSATLYKTWLDYVKTHYVS